MNDYNQPIIIPIAIPQDNSVLEEEYSVLMEKIEKLSKELAELKEKRAEAKREKKENTENNADNEYSEYKTDGKLKARATDSIRSYDDFYAVQQYFLDNNKIRDWAFWTVGVSLGIRVSDLTSLKIKDVLLPSGEFKARIKVMEKKTSKLNDCLITESITDALSKYFHSISWNFTPDDYVFKSQKKGRITPQHGWRIISSAGKSLGLPIVMGSHTMRKSFINIATCLRKYTIDMNAITIAQAHLNHSDQRITMRYMGALEAIKDEDRMNVSDFVLGRSHINKLIDGITKEI